MENNITLVQSPVIKHKLQEAGKAVSKRIEELELDKQVATVETVKSLKDLRADLNKELTEFETQRKLIKEGVNNPYIEFENLYKTEISEKYKSAIDTLKDKISSVENKIKTEKKESIETYFKELCVSESIDFITFDKLGIEVNLSTSEKKYKEQIFDYINKVNDDLKLIKSTDYEVEILTEYKSTLNVSNAITTVKTRNENEKNEQIRLKAEQKVNRINFLVKLGMKHVEITNSYDFNADIYITVSDIEDLSKEDFTTKYHDLEAKINDFKAKELVTDSDLEPLNSNQQSGSAYISVLSKTDVVTSPVVEPVVIKKTESDPLKKASFEVTATMNQLRALGEYMKQNNITYKNI